MIDEPVVTEPTSEAGTTNPYDLLANIKGAPTREQIALWKQGTCNGRVKLFTPDPSASRIFILRGLSGREMEAANTDIPSNTPPEKVEAALQAAVVAKGTLWTNVTSTGKLDEAGLRAAGAGLTPSLYELICQLSDFLTPVMLQQLSVDL